MHFIENTAALCLHSASYTYHALLRNRIQHIKKKFFEDSSLFAGWLEKTFCQNFIVIVGLSIKIKFLQQYKNVLGGIFTLFINQRRYKNGDEQLLILALSCTQTEMKCLPCLINIANSHLLVLYHQGTMMLTISKALTFTLAFLTISDTQES